MDFMEQTEKITQNLDQDLKLMKHLYVFSFFTATNFLFAIIFLQ